LKPDLIKIIQILRNREINRYDVKLNKADAQFEFLKQSGKEFQNLIVVQIKGDGNCFQTLFLFVYLVAKNIVI